MKRLVLLIACGLAAWGQGRLRPPGGLPCDRNQVTAYAGLPTAYARDARSVRVTIETDAGTVERVEVKLTSSETPDRYFRWMAEPFLPEHWPRLESSPGKLNAGVRVTAWVCRGGVNPILDWREPPR